MNVELLKSHQKCNSRQVHVVADAMNCCERMHDMPESVDERAAVGLGIDAATNRCKLISL